MLYSGLGPAQARGRGWEGEGVLPWFPWVRINSMSIISLLAAKFKLMSMWQICIWGMPYAFNMSR
jgi:hypothetical protein